MTERWKTLANGYQVSDQGRMKNRRGKLMKFNTGGHGRYVRINGKTCMVHRLVLEAFVGPCPRGKQARHLDGDWRNNKLSNLAWGTWYENEADKEKPYRGGNSTSPRRVRRSDGEEFPSMRAAAREVGLHVKTIQRALSGELKTAGGFTWEYA